MDRSASNRWSVPFACAVVLPLFISGCGGGGGGPTPAPPTPAPTPAPTPPPPPFWFMCADDDKCHHPGTDDGSDLEGSGDDEFQFQTWEKDPKALVDEVGDFSSVPAIDSVAYDHWAKGWDSQAKGINGKVVKLKDIADFAKQLLSENPFNTDKGAVPFLDFKATWVPSKSSDARKVVAISQRQLAFIIVNSLMDNKLSGGENGLHALLTECPNRHKNTYDFVHSILSILAILSQELAGGEHDQGKMLIGTTPGSGGNRNHKVNDEWRAKLTTKTLSEPNICNKVGDQASNCKVDDFMTGGTNGFQVLLDIAGNDVGGGSQLCEIANAQDESLVQFYTEVLAFAFFEQQRGNFHMLPVPFLLIGSRRYVDNIKGNTDDSQRGGTCGKVTGINGDIGTDSVKVNLVDGTKQFEVEVYTSSFLAQASECAAAKCPPSQCPHVDLLNNQCDCQRHFIDLDMARWYQVFSYTMYNSAVQSAFQGAIKRVGTGPWGSGVWFGDSQVYFLAMWMANSLLDDVAFDYYVYSKFCENPGNQCYVLGKNGGCGECLTKSKQNLGSDRCQDHGVEDVVKFYKGKSVNKLFQACQNLDGGDPTKVTNFQAFEVLFNQTHAPTPAPVSFIDMTV